jgi:hypothetical protein
VGRIPPQHYQTTTLISGIHLQGPCAPWLFDSAMDGEIFLTWVVQGLVPTLQKGDLVIMNNLATYKVQGVAEGIEPAGDRLRVSAVLFAGLKSYREHVEQGQTNPAQRRSSHRKRTDPSSQDYLPCLVLHRLPSFLF